MVDQQKPSRVGSGTTVYETTDEYKRLHRPPAQAVMTCPRCEGSLETYALGDRDAVVCAACGYVGVPADHSPDPIDRETWDDAIHRFRARNPESSTTVELADAEYRVSLELAHAIDALTESQRAVVSELLDESEPASPTRTYRELAEETGVSPSYVGDVVRLHGELAAAVKHCQPD